LELIIQELILLLHTSENFHLGISQLSGDDGLQVPVLRHPSCTISVNESHRLTIINYKNISWSNMTVIETEAMFPCTCPYNKEKRCTSSTEAPTMVAEKVLLTSHVVFHRKWKLLPLLLKTSSTVDTEIVVWRETLRGECFFNSGFLTVAEITEQDETLQTSNTNILYLFAYIS